MPRQSAWLLVVLLDAAVQRVYALRRLVFSTAISAECKARRGTDVRHACMQTFFGGARRCLGVWDRIAHELPHRGDRRRVDHSHLNRLMHVLANALRSLHKCSHDDVVAIAGGPPAERAGPRAHTIQTVWGLMSEARSVDSDSIKTQMVVLFQEATRLHESVVQQQAQPRAAPPAPQHVVMGHPVAEDEAEPEQETEESTGNDDEDP